MNKMPEELIFEKEKLFVSFSGGKTSAYMSYILKNEWSHQFDLRFVFANTGQENEETLVFVDKCDKEFGLNVVWVEAVVNPQEGKGITHKIVSFETASRKGEPYEAFIRKSGIPNANKPQCSDRLKALPIEDYKKDIGWKGCMHAIGIRKDEERRKSKASLKYNLVYPLCDWFESDKEDVNIFWEQQLFNLGLEEHEGNCKTCWKKSDKKLYLLALEHPERFEFMSKMEHLYEDVKPNKNGIRRTFFRRNRSTWDILKEASEFDKTQLRNMIGNITDSDSGCSESCEAYDD